MREKYGKLLKSIMFIVTVFACAFCVNLFKAEAATNMNCGSASTYTKEFGEEFKYTTEEVIIKNTSTSNMEFTINFKHDFSTKVSSNDFRLIEGLTNEAKGTVVLCPNEEKKMSITFKSYYKGGDLLTITTKAVEVGYVGGETLDKAEAIDLQYEKKGCIDGKTYRYFKINALKKSVIKFDLSILTENFADSEFDYVYLGVLQDTKEIAKYKAFKNENIKETLVLQPGEYVIQLFYGMRQSPSNVVTYDFKMNGRDYIAATGVKLTCKESSRIVDEAHRTKTFHLVAETIPANSDDKLDSIKSTGGCSYCVSRVELYPRGLNKKEFTLEISTTNKEGSSRARHHSFVETVKVTTTNNKTKSLAFASLAGKPFVGGVVSYHNSIVIGQFTPDDGCEGRIYIMSGNKWVFKSKSKTTAIAINGLKPNTSYKFKFVSMCKDASGKTIAGTPRYQTIKTGRAEKPSVKSVKISNIKVTSKKVWTKNYKGEWQYVTKYTTSYRVTVTLNKKLPGTLGLSLFNTKKSGKGTTFTFTQSEGGNLKGKAKTLRFQSYSQNSSISGFGAPVTKKVKIK